MTPATQTAQIGMGDTVVPVFQKQDVREVEESTARVLHLINGEHYAGAERVQDLLALALPEFQYEVSFACMKEGQFASARRSTESPLIELPMRSRLDLRGAWRLAKVVRQEGFQILHSHTVRSAMIAAVVSRLTGVPLVHHVHSPTSRDTTHRWRNRMNVLLERICLPGATALIVVSASLGGHVCKTMPRLADRVAIVPNGVPCRELFRRSPAPGRAPTLGTVALFRPRKGLEVLLQSLARLKADGSPVRLRAIGGFVSDEYQAGILALADSLDVADRIDWTGFTKDVDAELAQVDIFVLPSLFGEGLPMVVLEAMAGGLPVVSTDVEGIPEAIRDGIDGLIARPGDPEDLAERIDLLLTGRLDPAALGDCARDRQRETFSERSMARGVAAVYDAVLQR